LVAGFVYLSPEASIAKWILWYRKIVLIPLFRQALQTLPNPLIHYTL